MIAIIGAGISGLSTAFYLQKNNIPYTLFESNDRVGGYISTRQDGEYLMENGPNSLLCDDDVWKILEETGLKNKVVYPNNVSKARFILKDGRYRKLSPPSMVFGSFFNLSSKLSAIKEPFNKSKGNINESVANFFKRRFSQQIVDYAVNPFVSGIYAGNPDKLLIRYTFPSLFELEQKFGSVIKGFFKQKKKTTRKASVSFNGGMQTITDTLAKNLNINLNSPVKSIKKQGDAFLINEKFSIEKIVFTTPAQVTAQIIQDIFPQLSNALTKLNYPPMCIIHSVFKREDNMFPLNGFGGLHPKVEGKFTAGSIWSSSLFSGRAPKNEVLLTTFVGGSLSTEHTQLKDEEIRKKATQELKELFNIKNSPVKQQIFRWDKAIPQYDENLIEVEEQLKTLDNESVYINANWWGGVSVADCLKKGKALANKLSNI